MRLPLVTGAIAVAYAALLVATYRHADGVTLTSADDATRLLIAHSLGRHGVVPLHWTWPPLPMLVDAVPIALGGDAIASAAALRGAMMLATALLLARVWCAAVVPNEGRSAAFPAIVAAWLFFPMNVRLALSGLSEPYLYLLVVVGLVCWQHGVARAPRAAGGVPERAERWLAAAGFAFGLAVWARYEGALFVAVFSAALILDRGRGATRPVLVAVLPPLAWLAVQQAAFGDPLHFVHATRQVVRAEALALHGTERMPIARALDALRTGLWSPPIVALAVLGLARTAAARPRLLAGIAAFAALYGAMAAVTFGGRTDFYLNLFSLIVLPSAVLGADGLLARLRTRRRRSFAERAVA